MECCDVLAASGAEGIDEFEGRLSTLRGGADWLRHTLAQLLLLCRHRCIHLCVHTCTFVCGQIQKCEHMDVHVHTCACTHVQLYIQCILCAL